jgi:hypothetical protein
MKLQPEQFVDYTREQEHYELPRSSSLPSTSGFESVHSPFAPSHSSTTAARSSQEASQMLEEFFARKRASGEPISAIEQEGVVRLMQQGRALLLRSHLSDSCVADMRVTPARGDVLSQDIPTALTPQFGGNPPSTPSSKSRPSVRSVYPCAVMQLPSSESSFFRPLDSLALLSSVAVGGTFRLLVRRTIDCSYSDKRPPHSPSCLYGSRLL